MSQLHNPVTARDHLQGELSAPCIIVEYGDYECPSCGQIVPVISKLQKHFGKRLAFVFRNFPLNDIHPWAEAAAEAAEFAAGYQKFWEMHDLIYENQALLSEAVLLDCADKLGLPREKLREALSNRIYERGVQDEFSGGVRSGVNGTPTLFINGQRYDGSPDVESLTDEINQLTSPA